LILSGAFADTFRSEGVEFNIFSGEFNLHIPEKGTVNLIGEGVAAIWTIRALERVGFTVLQGGKSAQITVEVISSPEQFVWQITKNRDVSIYYSVSEVIKFLNIIR
jgi:iron complex transport system ATP-binding protein